MEIGELFKEWGGHAMAALAILGSIFVYFRHDNRIKKQEKILNDLQIKQFQKVEEQEKQAKVECNIIKEGKGNAKIRFYNSGLSDARNVRIDILNRNELDNSIIIHNEWGPYQLMTPRNGYREESFSLYEGHIKELILRITWDDDYGNNRSLLQSPQI